ncbi:type IV pilin [Natronomonas salsuginis]|uniref:Type IV pilin n=1 Tax=Natronomonas salsuginis TaxID=2217661 RepID=A0A4U5J654_9EURY|nr:type IV pilin N-terminal domain-containing protein [Natronomonas salsuginis]TKR24450.1 type IV pilin [Natronomonas salsuginis]
MERRAKGDRAISPVIGVTLMFVIVVLLAGVSAGMLLGFESQLRDPGHTFATDETVEVALQGNDTEHSLEFVHLAGQSVAADALRVRVGDGEATQTVDLDTGSAPTLADGEWSSGERLDLELDEDTICRGDGDTAEVTLVYDGADSAYVLSERRVPIERGQFVIRGDSVETTADFTANVKFLGTGWSSPTYDAPVNVSVRVNRTEVKAWELVGDSDTTVGSYGVSRQSTGTSISVRASGKESRLGDWRTTSDAENDEYLVVLRDGDPVPNYDAGSGQQDVAAYAEPFIDDGVVSLDDNQAIYLFDFNRQGPYHETADYQDAVVLVSFFAQRATEAQVHDVAEEQVIVCPAETKSASPNGGD